MQKILATIGIVSCFILFALVLFGSLRGMPGNPTSLEFNTQEWKEDGPFELSPERGRYALLYSYIEDKSLQFSVPVARFVAPDIAITPEGKYVSLFAPAVSFAAIPFYKIGHHFGIAQVGAFASSAFFAVVNMYLILLIVRRLGGNTLAGLLAGMVFVFATPAYAYAVTMYQHHISTAIILGSIYILIRWNTFASLTAIWFLCALSIVVDNPNLFFMFPIGFMALGRIVWKEADAHGMTLHFSPVRVLTFIGLVLPLLFFGWFNNASHGNPLQLSGTLESVAVIDTEGNPHEAESNSDTDKKIGSEDVAVEKTAVGFFRTRYLLSGMYIHILSPDRGMLTYTPIIFLGIYGLLLIYRRYKQWGALIISVALVNLLLYSMWGDPWGGWAFGSRYLIPSYALLSIGIGIVLYRWRKSILGLSFFTLLFIGCVGINTLGALTSSANPPQVQVLALEQQSGREEKYTYMRNWQYLHTNGLKTYLYQAWGHKYFTPGDYFGLMVGVIVIIGETLLVMLVEEDPESKNRSRISRMPKMVNLRKVIKKYSI